MHVTYIKLSVALFFAVTMYISTFKGILKQLGNSLIDYFIIYK